MAQLGTDIFKVISLLSNGDVVAIPTETVYGLAGNAYDNSAILKIFEIKNRPAFDPLIVHISEVKKAIDIAQNIPDNYFKLSNKLSPGPITYILEKKNNIPDLVTSGNPTVGVRIPRHPLTKLLLESLPFPLAAPSANPFGFVSPTNAHHVDQQLGSQLKYILDGGECSVGLESTIIDLTKGKTRILRLGGLTLEELEDILHEKITDVKTSSSNPTAPGMLISHYSPGCPIVLGDIDKLIKKDETKNFGVLSFGKDYSNLTKYAYNLSFKADLNEAAQNLFKGLRSFVNKDLDVIYTSLVTDRGLGRAINDRLKRAAATVV